MNSSLFTLLVLCSVFSCQKIEDCNNYNLKIINSTDKELSVSINNEELELGPCHKIQANNFCTISSEVAEEVEIRVSDSETNEVLKKKKIFLNQCQEELEIKWSLEEHWYFIINS